jgi:hypothetical protein
VIEDWADGCIQEVRKTHPIRESVAIRLGKIMGNQSEKPLRGLELSNAAKALITDMADTSTPAETKSHED